MNTTQLITMEDFFQSIGYDHRLLPNNHVEDISTKNIKVKSYNHETDTIEFKKILNIVKKQPTEIYMVMSGETTLLKCSPDHRVFVVEDNDYISVKDLLYKNFSVMSNTKEFVNVHVKKSNNIESILDMEVEDTNNYFSNGILSHNTGGNSLKFYASVRLDVRRVEAIRLGEEAIGNKVRVKVVKNKVAPPFRKVEFDVYFNSGISRENSLVDEGVTYGIVSKSGTWYSYGDVRLGQGKANCRQFLTDNKNIANEIETKIKAIAFSNPVVLHDQIEDISIDPDSGGEI